MLSEQQEQQEQEQEQEQEQQQQQWMISDQNKKYDIHPSTPTFAVWIIAPWSSSNPTPPDNPVVENPWGNI